MKMRGVITWHGYSGYAGGCRCDVCRTAKADYMRARRAEGRRRAQELTSAPSGKRPNRYTAFAPGASRYVAPIDKHGTRFGYEEWGCRCADCTLARTASDARYGRRADAAGTTSV